jgi:hypothetical protein
MPQSDVLRRPGDLQSRLWRARRRHHHIDATLVDSGAGWQLTFLRDDKAMVVWAFPDRAAAVADADRRLSDLLRAGWNVHW